jgi:eukaryotic-like serine/threonine-protein kinase
MSVDPRFPQDGRSADTQPAESDNPSTVALQDILDDQSLRWQRSDHRFVESYLQHQPELRRDPEQVLDLIYHEILLRAQQGECPQLEEYLHRFPEYSGQLKVQFEVYQAMASGDSLPKALLGNSCAESQPIAPSDRIRKSALRELLSPDGIAIPGYEVLRELGRGSMGVVFLARHTVLKRLVALKMFSPQSWGGDEQILRFKQEAEAVARLQHPNIVQIYEVGEYRDHPFFSLEFVSGGSLAQRIDGTPWPARQAAELLATLADAVHAAHERGIIHRDLKPGNVLLTNEQTPKITDFSLAKVLDGDRTETRTGMIMGTPSYMAPEQADGRTGETVPGTDVYALGVILYELLTGRVPFKGESVWDTLKLVTGQDPVPPRQQQPKVPRDLETICLKCLNKEPAKRYIHATDLANDLQRFLTNQPILARPASVWEQSWKMAKRWPRLSAGLATGLGSLIVLTVWHEIDVRAREAKAAQVERSAIARENRRATLATIGEGLHQTNAAILVGDWERAGQRLTKVQGLLEAVPAALRDDAELVDLHTTASRIRHQQEQHNSDSDCYNRFMAYVHEAEYFGTDFTGLTAQANRERTESLVRQALGLFSVSVESGAMPAIDRASFSEAQKQEVVECSYVLLLQLAEVIAGPTGEVTAKEDRQQVERALDVLNSASRLASSVRLFDDAQVCPILHSRRARYLERLGKANEARDERAKANDARPLRAFEFYLRGNDHYREGRLESAVLDYEKVLRLERNHYGALYSLAVCYLKLPRPRLEAAKVYLTSCINQKPVPIWPVLMLGSVQMQMGELPGAEETFAQVEQTLQRRPDALGRYALLVHRGLLRFRTNDFPRAVADLQQAIKLKPTEYSAYVNLSQVYLKLKDEKAALELINQAIDLRPPLVQASLYRNRAHQHIQMEDLEAALRDLDTAIALEVPPASSPVVAGDWFEKGQILMRQNKCPEAAEALEKSLALEPDNPNACRLHAQALLSLGRRDEALHFLDRYFSRELERRKPTAGVYMARGRLHVSFGHYAEAVEDYTRAIELERDNLSLYANRGWGYVALECPRLALRDFEHVLRFDPKNGDASNGRGIARVSLGQYQAAVKDADEALRLGPARDPRISYQAARIYAQAAECVHSDSAVITSRARMDIRLQYEQRALTLLRQSLALLTANQRTSFWRETVQGDPGFIPIRNLPDYRQLAESFEKSNQPGSGMK